MTTLEARLEGAEKDRAALEAVGLMGLPSRNEQGKFHPWDEAIAMWKERLAEMKTKPDSG
jgi:hypothetical protein